MENAMIRNRRRKNDPGRLPSIESAMILRYRMKIDDPGHLHEGTSMIPDLKNRKVPGKPDFCCVLVLGAVSIVWISGL